MLGIEDTAPGIRGIVGEKHRNKTIELCDNSVKKRGSRFDENTEAGMPSFVRLPMEGFLMRLYLENRLNLVARIWHPWKMPPSLYQNISRAQKQGVGRRGETRGSSGFLHPPILWSWICSLEKQDKSAPSFIWQPENCLKMVITGLFSFI